MKKLIIILFLFAFTVNAASPFVEDFRFKRDKQFHTFSGVVISGTVFSIVYKKTGDAAWARHVGIFITMSAAFGKEFLDGMQMKEISLADLLYTSVSGIVTGYLFQGIIKVKEKRQAKRIKKQFDISYWDLDNEFINKRN